MELAFIGLGSNLQQPRQQVESALAELQALPHSRCIAQSSLYRSAPLPSGEVATQEQPDYINAVAALQTTLAPLALLAALQALEQAHGRVRKERWGPRSLDLDLLLYGAQVIETETLTLPHAGLYERNFVLYPLAEIAAEHGLEVMVPGTRGLPALLDACAQGDLERLA